MRRRFRAWAGARVWAPVIVGLLVATPCVAQTFGQFTGAATLPLNGRMIGGYVLSGDNVLGALGQVRMSLYPGIDFGFQGGLARLNLPAGDRTSVRLGTDIKARIESASLAPFDLAVGGGLGLESSDEYDVLTLAPTAVISRSFPTSSGGSAITPYAGLALAFSRFRIQGDDRTDVSLPVRVGGNFDVSPGATFVIEMQLFVGADFTDDYQVAAGAAFTF